MKNALLILALTFGILSSIAQTHGETEDKIRTAINSEFAENLSECKAKVDAVTDFNGKTEFWNICNLPNGNRILSIESYQGETLYQEIYFEKNGELIYAKETENHMPANQFIQMSWNCNFYVKNGEIIALMSHGHGKTEDDEWQPEIIFEMHKNRLSELERIKK